MRDRLQVVLITWWFLTWAEMRYRRSGRQNRGLDQPLEAAP